MLTTNVIALRLKTIMQLQTKMGNNMKYSGVLNGLQSIWQSGGIRGFFQGNCLNCVKIFPESAAKFFVYENMKQLIADGKPSNELTIYQRFFAGSVAGATSQVSHYLLH
jgi:solute carrier family 25 phosphate transporter 23/24/25/41